MLLAVISDTHGHVAYTTEAIREIERYSPRLVVHCGDVGHRVVPMFVGQATRFVYGNTDDLGLLRHAIADAGLTYDGDFGEVELSGRRIAFLHGDDERRLHQAIHSGDYDLVCHGHTHQQRWEMVGTTRILNPGAIFRANPHSFAIVALPELTAEFVALPGVVA